jgi:hypothetical protein
MFGITKESLNLKKLILIFSLVLSLVFNTQVANAYNINNMTDDAKILSALKVLNENNQTAVLNRIDQSKTKIIFYDLSLISYSYSKHYAVASEDEYGDNYILINSNLRKSPVEALACLIAHESVHQMKHANFDEEVEATRTEARTWMLLKDRVSEQYSQDVLVQRLNKLAVLEKANSNLIAKSISENSFYQKQLSMK